jgi:penicillin-binding protein 1A
MRKRLFEGILFCLLILGLMGLGAAVGVIISYYRSLPSLEPMEIYTRGRWSIPSKVYSINGEEVARFYEERRELISLSEIPDHLINAVISIEDHLFFRHRGVNLKGVLRALWRNIMAGRIEEGGSSITQQLAKLLFLTPEKTYSRKVKEALLAIKIERRYTKEEILERYLNKVYFGHGTYGVEAASQFYFGKSAKDLDLAESALLAGLIKAPHRYSPIANPERAKTRQKIILRRMVRLGYISPSQADEAAERFLRMLDEEKIKRRPIQNRAPYFVEYIRQICEERYGDALYKRGLMIYTTLDLKMQEAAQEALIRGLERMNRLCRNKEQKVEGAIVAVDPKTGYIKAMVGGSGFTTKNQLNRVIHAKRQPGSAFKPFLYAAAIDNGFTASDTLRDEPVTYDDWGREWSPKNYDGKFRGIVTLRKALEDSINVASIRLMEKVTPERVVEYAHRMGIRSHLYPTLSLAIGTSEVTPLEICMAFGVFANQGIRVEPIAIRYVKDFDGVVLEENIPIEEEVLSKQTAYVITNMLEGVVKRGTGRWAIGKRLGRPVAGKTGTTNDFVDAWFVGFVPDLVAAVWVGYDKGQVSLGDRMAGGVVAAPIWRDFMEKALLDIPPKEFPIPEGICFETVCEESGFLATPRCKKPIREVFIQGTEPTTYCQEHQLMPFYFEYEG